MPDLLPRRGGVVRRATRATNRALMELDDEAAMQIGRIDQLAEIQAAKVDGATYVGKRAMYDVTFLTQAEQSLSTLVPLASSRLEAIGHVTTLTVVDLVSDLARKLR